jgi:hypothetical protein
MEQIILNNLTSDGTRHVKLMSDKPVNQARMLQFVPTPALDYAQIKCYDTAALMLFYGEVDYPAREAVDFQCEGWPKFRRLVVWKLMPTDYVSVCMEEARLYYFHIFMRHPRYAFIRKYPHIDDLYEANGLMLIEAEWALPGCLMVGG